MDPNSFNLKLLIVININNPVNIHEINTNVAQNAWTWDQLTTIWGI
jgi:hypothetical protein